MTLHRVLRTELPIVQAPMAGVQESALAVAVSNAGGLGSLPGALLAPNELKKQLAALTAQTHASYNVNFFCHTPPTPNETRQERWRILLAHYYEEFAIDAASVPEGTGRLPFSDETADILADFAPPIVSFHFGLPSEALLARVRSWGSTIISSATTVDEARWLEERGVDAIIAQGSEAGGHRGMFLSNDVNTQMGTFALLPQIVRAVRVPVIAAGGIVDTQAVRAALALGAAAVQVGTSYLLCPEATTSALHRAAVKNAASLTALTNVFTGRPARGIMNRLMRELGPLSADVPEFPLAASALAPLRAQAEFVGREDFSPMWAGQNMTGCAEVGAGELTRSLALGV